MAGQYQLEQTFLLPIDAMRECRKRRRFAFWNESKAATDSKLA